MSESKAYFITAVVFSLLVSLALFIHNLNPNVFFAIIYAVAVYGLVAMVVDFWRWVQ